MVAAWYGQFPVLSYNISYKFQSWILNKQQLNLLTWILSQVSVVDELGIPVKFVGIGEGVEDLQPFDAEAFVEAIFP